MSCQSSDYILIKGALQEVDELADPDMADFSSSQLVRDGEPFHKAKKGRTGGGRSSNRAAANTIEVIMGAPTGCVVIQDDMPVRQMIKLWGEPLCEQSDAVVNQSGWHGDHTWEG